MMKKFFFIAACLLHLITNAQYRPPGMADMRLINNMADVLETAMPGNEYNNARQQGVNAMQAKKDLIQETIKWTSNGGYLIRVRVLRNTMTGATVPMPPDFLGAGAVPSDILAIAASSPSISTAPSPGLQLATDKTIFVWVTQKRSFFGLGSKKLTYGYIVDKFAEQVSTEALKKMADADVMQTLKIAQQGDVLNGIAQNLKANVTEREAALRTSIQLQAYRKNLDYLNEIQNKLNYDLKKIDQANQALEFINSMRNILSIASLAVQVKAAMEDMPEAEINRARNPDELRQSVQGYRDRVNRNVEEYRRSVIVIENENTGYRTIIMDELYRMQVPATIIRSGFPDPM